MSPDVTGPPKSLIGVEQSCGEENPLAATVSSPESAGPLSTTVALKYANPKGFDARVPAYTAVLPVTDRHVIEVLVNSTPNAVTSADPLGFSPEAPLVTLTLNGLNVGCEPL